MWEIRREVYLPVTCAAKWPRSDTFQTLLCKFRDDYVSAMLNLLSESIFVEEGVYLDVAAEKVDQNYL